MRTASVAYAGSAAAFAGVLGWAATVLPDTVASHFGGDGRADGWSSRPAFLLTMAGIGGFLLLMPLVVRLAMRLPPGMVNVPNPDYWLAPEHREEMAARMTRALRGFTALTVLLLTVTTWQTVVATIEGTGLPVPWVPIALYLVAVLVWLVRLYRHTFAVPDPLPASPWLGRTD